MLNTTDGGGRYQAINRRLQNRKKKPKPTFKSGASFGGRMGRY